MKGHVSFWLFYLLKDTVKLKKIKNELLTLSEIQQSQTRALCPNKTRAVELWHNACSPSIETAQTRALH